MKNVIYPGSTKGVIHSERQVQPIGKDKTFLLMGFKGEQDMMENLNFLTMRCIDTGKIMWQLATHEYDINPFGKLVKRPQVMNEQGEITTHVSYYHGFFANFSRAHQSSPEALGLLNGRYSKSSTNFFISYI